MANSAHAKSGKSSIAEFLASLDDDKGIGY